MKIKNQISALLEKSYEYKACYDLFQNDNFINNNCNDILTLLKYAYLRSNLQYEDNDLNINGIDTNDICIKEFQDKLNSANNDIEKLLIEYFYIMKLKQQKGDLSDFVLRLEPFLKYIYENFVSYTRYNIYKELKKIKKNLRNTVAHQMINVSEYDVEKE